MVSIGLRIIHGRRNFCHPLSGGQNCALYRTEIVPSVLPFMEVVPKNVARVGADRSKQPQIGIPSQLFKRWRVRRQEAAPSEPQQKPLQSLTLLFRGKAPPCRRGI